MSKQTKQLGTPIVGAFVALGLLALLGTPVPANAAQSIPYDLDPGMAAKLAKEKVKQRGPRRRSSDYGSRNSADSATPDTCGQVDIGNSGSTGQRQSAAQRFRQRNQTVIVTGPVINAARCR